MDSKRGETPSRYVANLILQAIAHVRKRKARPDLQEICKQLKRRQNWEFEETRGYVAELLDAGVILRVEYKNNYSYRDPTDLLNGHVSGHISSTGALVEKIQTAIDGVVHKQRADHDPSDGRDGHVEIGASIEEIEAYFECEKTIKNDACVLRGNALKEVILSEVQKYTVREKKMDGTCRYSVGTRVTVEPREPPPHPSTHDTPQTEETKTELQAEGAATSEETFDDKRQRPPSKRKRKLKYTEDVYELNTTKKGRKHPQASSTTNESPIPTDVKTTEEEPGEQYRLAAMFRLCNEVHQIEEPSRHAGQEDEMLECCGCNMKAHPLCLNYSAQLLAKINRKMWRCVTCKMCAVCTTLLRTPSPLTCSGCDLAYHKSCHIPTVRKTPREGWLCMKCTGTQAPPMAERGPLTVEVGGPWEPTPSTSSSSIEEEEEPAEDQCMEEAEEGAAREEEEDSQHSVPLPPDGKSGAKNTAFPPTPRDSPSLDEDEDPNRPGQLKRQEEPPPQHPPRQMPRPCSPQNGSNDDDDDNCNLNMDQYDPQRVMRLSRFDGQPFPNPSKWSVQQVYEFVKSKANNDAAYINGAEALRREGIDGEVLNDLKRHDLLHRFNLPVGHALKLYRLIVNMRTNGNAHKYKL